MNQPGPLCDSHAVPHSCVPAVDDEPLLVQRTASGTKQVLQAACQRIETNCFGNYPLPPLLGATYAPFGTQFAPTKGGTSLNWLANSAARPSGTSSSFALQLSCCAEHRVEPSRGDS